MVADWRAGTVVGTRPETASGRRIALHVPGWGGNLAGQHLDLRLTAADGYQAARSYSIASVGTTDRVELAVDRVEGGEVSPFLVDELREGDAVEVRGPLGGWFVWRPEQGGPVQLVAGGSGVVPLVAILRAREAAGSDAVVRLLYSVRAPEDAYFRDELDTPSGGAAVTWVYTRRAPEGWPRPVGRVTQELLAAETIPAVERPAVFVCGPTAFVEAVAGALVGLGHDPARVRTERFGGL